MTTMTDATIEILIFPCLDDNYGLLLRDTASGQVAAIDTPDADRIAAELDERGWGLNLILNTHWHHDHVDGNLALKDRYGATVVGPDAERDRIPGIDLPVAEGATLQLGETAIAVIETPGHTLGHIVYHLPDAGALFVGDTLFAMGCGRLFEGTAEQMWANMERLAALPPETIVYCAHEYTQGNARFAATIEPDNRDLQARIARVDAARARNEPTVPFTIADERATNPFMRAGSAAELGRRRLAKDNFR
jgi:hydroxyacylglutathione hydrolase